MRRECLLVSPTHSPPATRLLGASEDVGVTGIQDGHSRATEELTAGGTQLDL
jgi:hypothetical protein